MGLTYSRPSGNHKVSWLALSTTKPRRHRRHKQTGHTSESTTRSPKAKQTDTHQPTMHYTRDIPTIHPNTWLLEDTQSRNLRHLNPLPEVTAIPHATPTRTHTRTRTTTTTATPTSSTKTISSTETMSLPIRNGGSAGNTKTKPKVKNKSYPAVTSAAKHTHRSVGFDVHADTDADALVLADAASLRLALDLARRTVAERHVAEEQEQERSVGSFWEVRGRERERVRESRRAERESVERERERERVERERVERESLVREIEKQEEEAALRRAVEEGVRLEMALWERERMEEMKVERQRELDRVLKEAMSKNEREVMKKKAREREDAAVAKAMENSIILEAAAETQTERLMRRMQRHSASQWAKDGTKTAGSKAVTRLYGPDLPPFGPRVGDPQASSVPSTYYGQFLPAGSYPTTYTNSTATAGPPLEPTWYGYNPSTTADPFMPQSDLDNDNQPTRWNSYTKPDLVGRTHAADWNNIGTGARHWHETTTQRWDAVIRRKDGTRGAYEESREVSKSTRRFP
ncbi:uncharacterized protein B0H64DRAFT_451361 [Chaetomium fimeti]|uniref:Uncharacterized protein n=1 Tax=Chaetomium fimeti TaxID=1854472 RepID=A0AAE0H6S0_9PEZI|nr:hypothetical protein B0H64DRAFT_451361 [Chaetomium fimeti]